MPSLQLSVLHRARAAGRALLAPGLALVLAAAAGPASAVVPAVVPAWRTVDNTTLWTTRSGDEVRAHGGTVVPVGAAWYWYGLAYDGTITDRVFSGRMSVKLYRSADLVHWDGGLTLISEDTTAPTEVPPGQWLGRPSLVVEPAGRGVVLVLSRSTGTRNRVAFYTAPAADGPFTRQADKEVALPDGHTMGNATVFQDGDGSAYLAFVSDRTTFNSHVEVARLTADHLGVGAVLSRCGGGHREALSVLHRGGWYYLFASETRGWLPSTTWVKRAHSMAGFACSGGQDGRGWTRVATDPSNGDSFGTQHAGVVTVRGTRGTVEVAYGDRWWQFDPRVPGPSRYGWYPLTFDRSGMPVLHGHDRWQLDAAAGLWR